MTLLQAVLMGIIQGLTEFLPVSSSGHLALFKILFHVETDTGMLFDVLLHVGTLIAICAVYYKDIVRLFVEGICIVKDVLINFAALIKNLFLSIRDRGKDHVDYSPYRRIVNSSYRKFVVLILVSTIPTGIIGFVGKDVVEQASELLIVPGICLIATAILLFIADRCKGGDKLPKDITYTNAFVVGIAQGVATLPGLSRSGTTITACLLSGFNRKFAVKYSFIMSIPAVLGAVVLEVKDLATLTLTQTDIIYCIIAMVVAAVSGYLAIRFMMGLIRGRRFKYFAIYCAVVSVASVIALLRG